MIQLHGMYWPRSVLDTRGEAGARKHTGSYVGKAAKHLPALVEHCSGYQCVIQAGGHCGAWPRWLAEHFGTVLTWEPDPENFSCLARNIPANVTARNALLGKGGAWTFRHNDWNTGGHHAVPQPGDTPSECIDDIVLGMGPARRGWSSPPVVEPLVSPDAIVLDIEGMELPALEGAAYTIARCRPVIMIEDRGHGDKYGWGEALPWLLERGYEVAAEAGHDKVLVPS